MANAEVQEFFEGANEGDVLVIAEGEGLGRLHFAGVGGSGMSALAQFLAMKGERVSGSDRAFDRGQNPEARAKLERLGIVLTPQDGRGVAGDCSGVVYSTAVEETVPDFAEARRLGVPLVHRSELLAHFVASHRTIAITGTSGKSTTTAMLGWVLAATGREPTIMNGAVMKNFVGPDNPFASATVGSRDLFVSEVDESDGSIALYRPSVAVLLNVSLDHKSMEELRQLFGDFVATAQAAAINFDDPEARALAVRAHQVVGFGIDSEDAQIGAADFAEGPTALTATIIDREAQASHALTLQMPGRHNLANALAAIAAARAAGVPVADAVAALAGFRGLARRFDILGTSAGGVTVIDDFGHNPEKARATLRTLKAQPGRVIAFFQPHGYGPLRQMGAELAQTFAEELGPDDVILLCDPVYFGGTVDRSEGSERIVGLIKDAGGNAGYLPTRDECGDRIVALARPGDRVAVMGARDDTLTAFAESLLQRL
jgi:UDP-N-acetylmuramate--alanine ligase